MPLVWSIGHTERTNEAMFILARGEQWNLSSDPEVEYTTSDMSCLARYPPHQSIGAAHTSLESSKTIPAPTCEELGHHTGHIEQIVRHANR